MKNELNFRQFRHLTIFGKATIIKTLCLPKFMNISTVIPNLCLTRLNEIEREWENFIKAKGCPIVNMETRYRPTKENGLRMIRLVVFWRLVHMAWLRRLTTSKSTWKSCTLRKLEATCLTQLTQPWRAWKMPRKG